LDVAVILAWLGFLAIIAAIVGGLVLGGPVERRGALICVAGGVLSVGLQARWPDQVPFLAMLAIDLGMAIAFTWLALKHPSRLWPGVAAVSLTLLAAFSASRAIGFPLSEQEYRAALNVASIGVALAILGGVWARRRPQPLEEELA